MADNTYTSSIFKKNLNELKMDETDYKAFTDAYENRMQRLTEMVENQEKQRNAVRDERTTCAVTSDWQTTCAHNPFVPQSASRQRGFYDTSQPSRQKIEKDRLVIENEKLKQDYAELLKKTSTLVEAYKKLEVMNIALTEKNNALTAKKAKVDAKKKTVEDTRKVLKTFGERFMTWLKS